MSSTALTFDHRDISCKAEFTLSSSSVKVGFTDMRLWPVPTAYGLAMSKNKKKKPYADYDPCPRPTAYGLGTSN